MSVERGTTPLGRGGVLYLQTCASLMFVPWSHRISLGVPLREVKHRHTERICIHVMEEVMASSLCCEGTTTTLFTKDHRKSGKTGDQRRLHRFEET